MNCVNRQRIKSLIIAVVLTVVTLLAQYSRKVQAAPAGDPPCKANLRLPRIALDQCGETIIQFSDTQGIASTSAMTFGPDGSLYVARPAVRQIVRFVPDGNGFISAPDLSPQIFAADLPEPPVGITYADGNWYISGDTMIVRLQDKDVDGTADAPEVLVRDLPGGVGGWLGNIHIGPDKRLYVAKAASCAACAETDDRRAALLSFALDGSDIRIVARGLHNSYDFGWVNGTLYIVDDERDSYPAELNAIPKDQSGIIDFGWPQCSANGSVMDGADCKSVVAPVATFPPDSHPSGVLVYSGSTSEAMPPKGSLLVVLKGDETANGVFGYVIQQININSDGKITEPITLAVPKQKSLTYSNLSDASIFYLTFYPTHPVGIVADSQGWLYISTVEGTITRIRPRPTT